MYRYGAYAFVIAALTVPAITRAATLSLDPSSGSFGPGDTVIVALRLDTQGTCINAAEAALSYPANALRVVDVSRGDSIFSLWTQDPHVDPAKGIITVAGGVPGGYCGVIAGDPSKSNVLARVIFTVLKTEAPVIRLSLESTSAVYMNDGLGTRAALTLSPASFTVARQPQSSINEWLTQLRDDHSAPESFDVQLMEGGAFGSRYAVFSTVDKQTGIDHYEVNEAGVWIRAASPYALHFWSRLGALQVKAVDKAGNERISVFDASSTPLVSRTSAGEVITLIAILIVLFSVWWLVERWYKRRV